MATREAVSAVTLTLISLPTFYVEQAVDNGDLHLLLAITDLLASCSEGETELIESVCQSIYTTKELFRILCVLFLPPNRKRPFARFLAWAYLNVSDKPKELACSRLAYGQTIISVRPHFILTCREMWCYLEQVAILLERMADYVRETGDSKWSWAQPARLYATTVQWDRCMRCKPHTPADIGTLLKTGDVCIYLQDVSII